MAEQGGHEPELHSGVTVAVIEQMPPPYPGCPFPDTGSLFAMFAWFGVHI